MPEYILIDNPTYSLPSSTRLERIGSLNSALKAISDSDAESVLLIQSDFWHNGIPPLPKDFDEYDLLHSGLCLGGAESFASLRYVSSNWLFLNPRPDRCCTSWKATPHWCLLRPKQVAELGGFEKCYQTPEATLMDFAYRLLLAGGRVNHHPVETNHIEDNKIPLFDEIVFLNIRINRSAALYASFWCGRKAFGPFVRAMRSSRVFTTRTFDPALKIKSRLIRKKKNQKVNSISAIIPTISRYEYIQNCIESLIAQTVPPDEIIVVDQTPKEERQPEIYKKYDPNYVKVFFLDQAGQSTSRNFGLEKARFDWCLLFEDDAAAWKDMMINHIQLIEHSSATASTGVSLAPWKDVSFIPERNRHIQISSVFYTGISLVKKDALEAVGKLDQAYDKGSGADHDLGLRLYLEGYEVIFNPGAILTHYKAPKGGLRTYGVYWRNTVRRGNSFPQPTLIYTAQRFYPRKYWLAQYLLYYFSAVKDKKLWQKALLWGSMPVRLLKALSEVKQIHRKRSVQ